MKLLLALLASVAVLGAWAIDVPSFPSRHAYKHTVKKPYFFGGPSVIPHFTAVGDVITSPDYIRLVPGVRSQRGGLWNDEPLEFKNWQVEMEFVVTGRGRLGGDGLALWYVKDPRQLGQTFGSRDRWDGLAIFMDTYDNDGKRDNPAIMGVLNDGTIAYNHGGDGQGQFFGSCPRMFRNTQAPVRLLVTYVNEQLSVYVDIAGRGRAYTLCFSAKDIALPTGYYLGVSAATGALADDHDLIYLETKELFPSGLPERAIPKEAEPTESPAEQQHMEEIADKLKNFKNSEFFELDESYKDLWQELAGTDQVMSKLESVQTGQEQLKQMLQNFVGSKGPQGGAASVGSVLDSNRLREIGDGLRDMQNRMTTIENSLRVLQTTTAQATRGNGGSDNSQITALMEKLNSIETIASGTRLAALNTQQETRTALKSGASQGISAMHIVGTLVFGVLAGLAGFFLGQRKQSEAKKFV